MAEVTVKGSVVAWRYGTEEPSPEWAFKFVESHNKKNADGSYQVIGSTVWQVRQGWNDGPTSFDFSQYQVGDKLLITGTQITQTNKNGETVYKNLLLKAKTIEVIGRVKPTDIGLAIDEDAPF